MKTSREQFEEWYSNRYGFPDFSKAFEHAKMADAFEVWQASRQCIEVGGGDCVNIKLQNGGEASIRDVTKIEIVEYKGA